MALMSSLVDPGTTLNAGLWTPSSGQVTSTGGAIRINHTAASQYNDYNANTIYDLTGNYAYVQVKDAGNQALTSHEVIFLVDKNFGGNNQLMFYITGNTLFAYKNVAGAQTAVGSSVAYSTTNHKWLRIREASGTIFWDTSANGVSWTNFTSAVNPFGITDMVPILRCGNWQNEATASYADFVDFNTLGTGGATGSTGQFFPMF